MARKPTLGAADRLAKILESWKTIVAFLVFLVLLGIRFETWQSSLARADDVDLNMKALKIDIKSDLNLIRQQLFEIAKSTGARQIAPVANEGNAP